MAATILTFRDTIRNITPRWLRGTIGARFLYSIATQLDALQDAMVEAVGLKYPDATRPDALALLGDDRKIDRGRNESDEIYASRLAGWLDANAHRGNPIMLLKQLHAFYGAAPFRIHLLSRNGKLFSMDQNGDITESTIAFSPDALPEQWARWWLYFEWPDAVGPDGIWSDPGDYDDGGVWDSDLSPADVADIRLVPTRWNAAHTIGNVMVVSGGSIADMLSTLGAYPVTSGDAGAIYVARVGLLE